MNDGVSPATNRREVFRVPVYHGMPVSCVLLLPDQSHDVKVMNIGLTGISVRVPHAVSRVFLPGSSLQVQLHLKRAHQHDLAILVDGIVRRNSDGNLGIVMPMHRKNHEVHPPDVYRLIVMELQRRYNHRRRNAF